MKFVIILYVVISSSLTAYSQGDLFNEIDSTESFNGLIMLKDYNRIESTDYMVKKDFILVGWRSKLIPDTINVTDVRYFTIKEPASLWQEGMGVGILGGVLLATFLTDPDLPDNERTNLVIAYFLGSVAVGTVVGLLIPTTTDKSYHIQKYYGITMDLNYKQINPWLTHNSLNLKFSINI